MSVQKLHTEKKQITEVHPEQLDLEIIRALQADARSSFRDIARKLKVAVGTVQSRVKKMEESNVIRGFSVEVDYSKLGYSITALILLQAKGKHLKDVETKLAKFDNVGLVYDITGDFDIAMVAKFLTPASMDKFIKEVLAMDFVERAVTSIVLNSVKENLKIPVQV
ncbi:MAG: Lrp/AsnC family transcriptional regulator [Thaumarchaeota archaeon]|nr:Lrp/AsnC family transcriptional regulator [Nitrososphaerota archaeon]